MINLDLMNYTVTSDSKTYVVGANQLSTLISPPLSSTRDSWNWAANMSNTSGAFGGVSAYSDSEICKAGLCFATKHTIEVICYTLLFFISLIGNGVMFFVLLRNIKKAKAHLNRVYFLLLHLNIANLIVTLINFPFKIINSITVGYYGPAWACPILKFTDVFGLYLASFVLICMSIDRLFAIVRPLYALQALRQVKIMIGLAWQFALLFSLPQVFLFRRLGHPRFKEFTQCTAIPLPEDDRTFRQMLELSNTIINFIGCYFLPATFIIVCYALILLRIMAEEKGGGNGEEPVVERKYSTKSRRLSAGDTLYDTDGNGHLKRKAVLRRSSQFPLRRAKSRTLRMTFAVVSAFLICWTPYFGVVLFRFIQEHQGKKAAPGDASTILMKAVLYAFAFFNTALNPYLYGYFSFNFKHELKELVRCCRARYPGIATADEGQRLQPGTAAHRRLNSSSSYRAATPSSPAADATSPKAW